jgi:hypothetical protein
MNRRLPSPLRYNLEKHVSPRNQRRVVAYEDIPKSSNSRDFVERNYQAPLRHREPLPTRYEDVFKVSPKIAKKEIPAVLRHDYVPDFTNRPKSRGYF